MEPQSEKSLERPHGNRTKKCENVKRVSRKDEELLSTSAKRNCGDKARRIIIDGD